MLIENFIARLFSNTSRLQSRRRKARKSASRQSIVAGSEALEARALLAATATVAITTSANPGEADGTVPFSVTLTGTGTLDNDVSITATSAAGTATGGGADFNDFLETITFAAGTDLDAAGGSVSASRDVTLTNDQSLEVDEGLTVDLSALAFTGPDAVTLGNTSFGVTINDDEAATIDIAASSAITEEGSAQSVGVATLTITGSGTGGLQLGDGISITADVTDAGTGSGTSGTDYVAVGTQTLTFDSNAATGSTQSATITTTNDQSLEMDEVVNLTLGNLSAASTDTSLGTVASAVTIDDDESATLNVAATSTVTEEGGAQAVGVVTLTITGTGTGGLQLGDGISLTADITDATTGSGISGTDFDAIGTQTVTFDSNAATGATANATATPTNDQSLETNETIDLTLGNLSAAGTDSALGTTASVVTIDDDESATLAIAGSTSVTEEGGIQDVGVVTLTITGSGTGALQLGDGITLTADITDAGTGTSTTGGDYIDPGTQTVTFDSNAATGATQDGALVVNNDRSLENSETIRLSLGNAAVAGTDTVLGNTTHIVNIDDDEVAVLNLAASSTVDEESGVQAAGAITLTITGTGSGDLELGDGISITADITDATTGTGVSGTDYTAVGTQTITFDNNAGDSDTENATLVIANDQFLETNETVDLVLGNLVTSGTDVSLGTTTHTATIDDDEAATLSVTASSTITEEGGAQATAGVMLVITGSGTGGLQLGDGITLTADLVDGMSGTATTGTDYTGMATQTMTFDSNAATGSTQTASFTALNDQSLEANESIDVTLGNLSNSSTDTTLGTTVGIITVDDDEAATLSIASTAAVTEIDGAQTVGVVTLSITGSGTGGFQLGDGITLTADVTDAATGTGTSIDDYDAVGTQTVTFTANAADGATGNSLITVVNDQSLETNETVNLSLGNISASGTDSTLGTSTQVVTIDDDEAATVDVVASSSADEEGGIQEVATLTLTITGTGSGGLQLGSGVSVSADVTDDMTGSAVSGSDYAVIGTHTVTFDSSAATGATQSAMLSVTNDQSLEADETIDLTVGNLVTGGTDSSLGSTAHTVTIGDDESATLDIEMTSTVTEEGGSQTAGVVTLNITGTGTGGLQLGDGITLTADIADSTAGTASAGDYAAVGMQTVTFDSNAADGTTASTMITPVNDQSLEAGETITLSLGNFGATNTDASLGTTSNVVTIDDDEAATIDISASSNVTEAGGAQSIGVVTLSITGSGTGALELGDGISISADITDAMTGTATSVDDFDAVGTHTVTFDSNAATGASSTAMLTPVNDNRAELDETVNLMVGNLMAAGTDSMLGTTSHTVTIEDDDDGCNGYGPGDAITLDSGTVFVPGTMGDDVVSTSEVATDLRITFNSVDTDFDLGMVTRVVICSFDGADTISLGSTMPTRVDGGYGNDTIMGGPGADKLAGGQGDDVIEGEAGDDSLFGGSGNDRIEGGSGHDSMGGGSGGDTLIGNTGRDSMNGSAGKDRLIGSGGADHIEGGNGRDNISGNGGNDTVMAGLGNDVVTGGRGDDELYGQEGNDNVIGAGDNDMVVGGEGNDSVAGGQGDDTIHGDAGDDLVNGGSGADILMGGDDNDTVLGSNGFDILFGGSGMDSMAGGSGGDIVLSGGTTLSMMELNAIMSEWGSSRDYNTRVANISGNSPTTPRNNGDNFATVADMVDDGVADTLTGNDDADWFFASSVDDTITDLMGGEAFDDIGS